MWAALPMNESNDLQQSIHPSIHQSIINHQSINEIKSNRINIKRERQIPSAAAAAAGKTDFSLILKLTIIRITFSLGILAQTFLQRASSKWLCLRTHEGRRKRTFRDKYRERQRQRARGDTCCCSYRCISITNPSGRKRHCIRSLALGDLLLYCLVIRFS